MAVEANSPSFESTQRTAAVNPLCTPLNDIDDAMGRSPSERLAAARERAGFATRDAAVTAFGWPKSAYNHHEGGIRGFGVEQAKRYGRAFRVSPAWLMGLDPDVGEPADMIALPSDEVLAAIIVTLLDGIAPNRSPSEDLIREMVSALRSTLATLPKAPSAFSDPEAARLVALGIAARS